MTSNEMPYDSRLQMLREVAGTEPTIQTPHGISLVINDQVLIPSAETFELIDLAKGVLEQYPDIGAAADIGTGTGVIGVTLAKMFGDRSFFGVDVTDEAIRLAKLNARINGAHNVSILKNNSDEWMHRDLPQNVGLIVSNPPFVGDAEFSSSKFVDMYPEAQYEPAQAIRTYDQYGMHPYLSILQESQTRQTPFYLFQCNADFQSMLVDRIDTSTFNINTIKDKRQTNRFLLLQRKQPK